MSDQFIPSTPAELYVEERDRNARIEAKLDEILEKMNNVEAMTVRVIEEVKPTIDELMQSQLVKMLGMGKRK